MSSTLEVPAKKKVRPKSPRRKAPTAPKKKDSTNGKAKGPQDKDSLGLPEAEYLGKNGKGKTEKSMKRSLSPRSTEGYSSLLEEMVGMGDMVLLDPITEDSIIQNLKKRYEAGEIYVSMIGVSVTIVVSKAVTISGKEKNSV